jgi:hypothetical protein
MPRTLLSLTELYSQNAFFLPSLLSFLSFSAGDLHTVYDGYMIVSTAKFQATILLQIDQDPAPRSIGGGHCKYYQKPGPQEASN